MTDRKAPGAITASGDENEITKFGKELLYVGKRSEALLEVFISWDDVAHLTIVISLVSCHVKVTCTCEVEQDRLSLTGLLALESLVDRSADGV